VVNIGSRQHNRLAGTNAINAGYERREIVEAIQAQVKNGRYPADPLYGSGDAGIQIAQILATINPPIQKTITY
jgi:adenosylmethionine-8-amino-7-oxononanoate aminotransferase